MIPIVFGVGDDAVRLLSADRPRFSEAEASRLPSMLLN
jgi:hypothetical protein